jgi:pimeloyl-ACP methyl ester carboxylesterase
MAAAACIDRTVAINGGHLELALRIWPPTTAVPARQLCVAWPGWLDNAGSFDSIAPHFAAQGYTFVACDPPGCGQSDHLPASAVYMDLHDAGYLIECVDALGYDTHQPFVLVGHSRGSGVVTACAAAFPSRIAAVVTFESSWGLSGTYPMDWGPAARKGNHKLAEALDGEQQAHARGKRTRVFATVADAVSHNQADPRFVKTVATSENIVARHLVELPDGKGWRLTHDPRLYGQWAPIYPDEQVNRLVLSAVRCPMLDIKGNVFKERWRGMIRVNSESSHHWSHIAMWERLLAEREALLRSNGRLTTAAIVGGHHVHSDKPQACAEIALPWLDQLQLPQAPQIVASSEQSAAPGARVRIDEEDVEVPEDLWTLEPTPPGVPPPTEQNFAVCGGTLNLAAKVWAPADGSDPLPTKRVLAWPGWLDNAGSFDTLAPLMVQDGFTIVAMDPPGCGMSDHLPAASQYCTETETLYAFEVLQQLGWTAADGGAVLLAHSRGGNVLLRCAGGFSDSIVGLVLLENSLGYSESFSAGMIADMLAGEVRNRARVPRSFKSAEAAVHKSFHNDQFPKSWATARNITARHIVPDEAAGPGGYTFSHDVRTYGERQALATTPDMLLKTISRVQCPVFMMTSELNEWRSLEERTSGEEITKKKAQLASGQLTAVVIMGEHHHVHSDNAAATWDTGLREWLGYVGHYKRRGELGLQAKL